MTPKEKAIELTERYFWKAVQTRKQAKQCSLICVDEILEIFNDTNGSDYRLEYWKEVKKEIENL